MSTLPLARAEIVVDLAMIRHNVRTLRQAAGAADLMVVVKADGYGHGLVEVARAARAAGAPWIGAATLDEALALRDSGDTGPVLAWLTVPGEDWAPAIAAGVDVTAYSLAELETIAAAATSAGRPARVQLKIDTGMNRGGALPEDWPALVGRARRGEVEGHWRVTGIWSHPACADQPDHPANAAQEQAFGDALAVATDAGLRPAVRHLANSAATLLRPSVHFDLVRCGIASYGLDPAPGTGHGTALVPAMTARTRLAQVKRIPAGASVSYGHTWTADRPTTVGLVPLGYGDGVPRHGGNRAQVWIDGQRRPVIGRVCMDQFVVDLGPGSAVTAGTEVELFGTGLAGGPTAQDWAEACETISYEIVTRIGGRMTRRYVDTESDAAGAGRHPDPTGASRPSEEATR